MSSHVVSPTWAFSHALITAVKVMSLPLANSPSWARSPRALHHWTLCAKALVAALWVTIVFCTDLATEVEKSWMASCHSSASPLALMAMFPRLTCWKPSLHVATSNKFKVCIHWAASTQASEVAVKLKGSIFDAQLCSCWSNALASNHFPQLPRTLNKELDVIWFNLAWKHEMMKRPSRIMTRREGAAID